MINLHISALFFLTYDEALDIGLQSPFWVVLRVIFPTPYGGRATLKYYY
jgi:hypothetical protein